MDPKAQKHGDSWNIQKKIQKAPLADREILKQ